MINQELDAKYQKNLTAAINKMKKAKVDPTAIRVFANQYRALASGATGIIHEDDILPLQSLPKTDDLKVHKNHALAALNKTVVIKLNGGLGTTMGLDKTKTLLPVKNGDTFLDIMIGQILNVREKTGASLPLIFMNSFRTHDDTFEHIKKHDNLRVGDLPMDFIQNTNPKIHASTLEPISWPDDATLEWNPPGHGDIYPALWDSGVLDELIDRGFSYAFISNADNLGAVADADIAGWFTESGASFAMEVCRRSVNDRKGGHLAIRKSDGRVILREAAQTMSDEMEFFTDENRHRFFNTNNIWINLPRLKEVLVETEGVLDLPIIRNIKTVNPTDPSSPEVIQIESAMGSAIEIFEGATAIEVPRSRFMPIKSTNELLLMRSDAFDIDKNYMLSQKANKLPKIELDSRYYKFIADFDKRFKVIPSLKNATSFRVEGDHTFDQPLDVKGDVLISE
jgi:UTP--glucose-1-phosphate uridylyltransferase